MVSTNDINSRMPGYFNVDAVKQLPDDERVFTIADFQEVTIKSDRGEEEKPVLFFDETKKGLVLSKGRAEELTRLFSGEETIIGKKVLLSTRVDRGREQICICAPE